MKDLLLNTLMSQYANSPRMLAFIYNIGEALDPTKVTKPFFDMVINISTAQGEGLDVWGRIVGVSRDIHVSSPPGMFFGFEEGFYPFDQQPFLLDEDGTSTWPTPDHLFRNLIMIKAMANIVYATAPNINVLLWSLFQRNCYYLTLGNMRGRYVFEFSLSPFERHIVYNTDILPRPCGVLIDFEELDPASVFGFFGTEFQPFNQGIFA